jgi:hypothetical protein
MLSLKDIKKQLSDNNTVTYYHKGTYVEITKVEEYRYEYSIRIGEDSTPTRKHSISGLTLDKAVDYIYNILN